MNKKNLILIVDDEEEIRLNLEELLKDIQAILYG
jgi:FixJ family two-component response regulator